MPLLPGLRQDIEVPVSDRVMAGTIIKQKAKFLTLTHSQVGVASVKVTVLVTPYADDNGAFGPALSGPHVSPYKVEIVGDNLTVVDAATGQILAERKFETEVEWQAKLNSYEQPVMLQGDFFEMLRETQGVHIGDLIRQHIGQADLRGRFS